MMSKKKYFLIKAKVIKTISGIKHTQTIVYIIINQCSQSINGGIMGTSSNFHGHIHTSTGC